MSQIDAKLLNAKKMMESGRWPQAKVALTQALQKAPTDQNALVLMRFCLAHMNEHPQALYYAQKAAELFPTNADIQYNLSASFAATLKPEPAIAAAKRALEINPKHRPSIAALTALYAQKSQFVDSLEQAQRGMALDPLNPMLAMYAAAAMVQLGRADEAIRELRPAVMKMPPDLELLKSLVTAHMYAPSVEPSEVFAAHMSLGRMLAEMVPEVREPFANDLTPDRPLRIGIFTSDARRHAVWFFLKPFLDHYDRSKLRVTVYSNSRDKDDFTATLRQSAERDSKGWDVPAWREVFDLEHEPTMRRIRDDRIDILVDLNGWTINNGMVSLAMRAAPIQAEWLGYPYTTGVSTMDYRITDSLLDPESTQSQSRETLFHAEPCSFAWIPAPDTAPANLVPPSQREGTEFPGITFGSFTAPQKLNDPVVRAWCRIVRETPGSRLLLKHGVYSDQKSLLVTRHRFLQNGMDESRLIFEGAQVGATTIIGNYNRIDICLDPWPYTGMTTMCECAHMGVPFIHRFWDTAPGRAAATIARHAGLEELTAFTDDQYVTNAIALAKDPDRLRMLRERTVQRFAASPARDGRGMAERIEKALRAMWVQHCKNAAKSTK